MLGTVACTNLGRYTVEELSFKDLRWELLELAYGLDFPGIISDRKALERVYENGQFKSLAFYATAVFGKLSNLDIFYKDGIDLYEKDIYGDTLGSITLLGIASNENFTGNRTRQIKNICQYGFDINHPLSDGSTFMFTLVNTANIQTIRNIIDLGVNLNHKDYKGRTILSDIRRNSSTLVSSLITPNTDYSVLHASSNKPIIDHYTSENGYGQVAKAFKRAKSTLRQYGQS